MSTNTSGPRPGIVIFAALLNFINALMWLAAAVSIALALALGMAVRLSQAATAYVPQWTPPPSSGALLIAIGCVLAGAAFLSALFFLIQGIALLRGSALAWYIQIVLSVLGLFFVPVGTALSILILAFFFQRNTREFFGIR